MNKKKMSLHVVKINQKTQHRNLKDKLKIANLSRFTFFRKCIGRPYTVVYVGVVGEGTCDYRTSNFVQIESKSICYLKCLIFNQPYIMRFYVFIIGPL